VAASSVVLGNERKQSNAMTKTLTQAEREREIDIEREREIKRERERERKRAREREGRLIKTTMHFTFFGAECGAVLGASERQGIG
jgi:hypothetical protein